MKKLILICVSLLAANAFAENPLTGLPDIVAARQKALIADGTCEADQPFPSESYTLNSNNQLFIVPCVMGAYQGSSRVYLLGSGSYVSEVTLLAYDEEHRSIVGSIDLGEASYDPKKRLLSTFAKGRGLGDCGQESTSRVLIDKDGYVSIKTVEIRAKVKCDGKMTAWPVVFKQ